MAQHNSPLRCLARISTFLCTLTLLVSISHVSAEISRPHLAGSYASAYVDNKALFVTSETSSLSLNSSTSSPTTPSTFMVDLTTSWKTSQPALKELAKGPFRSFMATATSADGQTWLALNDNAGYIYDTQTSTWTKAIPTIDMNHSDGLTAVTDPETDIVYVPNGSIDNKLLTINLKTKTVDHLEMLPSIMTTTFYTAAWSASHKGFLLLGANDGALDTVYLFHPAQGWKTVNSTGTIPSPRVRSCFVPIQGGAKMVLFGGYLTTRGGTAVSELFILDTATMTWSQGADAQPENSRGGAACAVAANQLVVVGGASFDKIQDSTLVYDLDANAWNQGFVAAANGDAASSEDNSSTMVILGGVLGALAVILAVAGMVFYRFRSKRSKVACVEKNMRSRSSTLVSANVSVCALDPKKEFYSDLETAPAYKEKDDATMAGYWTRNRTSDETLREAGRTDVPEEVIPEVKVTLRASRLVTNANRNSFFGGKARRQSEMAAAAAVSQMFGNGIQDTGSDSGHEHNDDDHIGARPLRPSKSTKRLSLRDRAKRQSVQSIQNSLNSQLSSSRSNSRASVRSDDSEHTTVENNGVSVVTIIQEEKEEDEEEEGATSAVEEETKVVVETGAVTLEQEGQDSQTAVRGHRQQRSIYRMPSSRYGSTLFQPAPNVQGGSGGAPDMSGSYF